MSYELVIEPNFALVRLLGNVNALDLLKSHEEEIFLDALKKTHVVIYDYSGAERIDIDEKGAEQLGKLANRIADYQNPIHIIIVPQSPENKYRAELYKATVSSPDICVDIVTDLKEASLLAETFS